jgi:predicted nuclease of predicted toxin-antitoxin system
MLRFLSDENFNGDIVRGLFLRQPDLDLLRVQDVGLGEADDPTVLKWSAENDRIVLTHDRATMPDFAYERLVKQEQMSVRQAIDEILLLVNCSQQSEWKGIVLYLPL